MKITLIYAERGSAARIAYIGTQYDTGSKGLPMMNTDRYVQLKPDPPKYIFPAHTCNLFNLPDRLGGKP